MNEIIQFASSANRERNASTANNNHISNNTNNNNDIARSNVNAPSTTFISSTTTLANNISNGVNTNTLGNATSVVDVNTSNNNMNEGNNSNNNNAVPGEQQRTERATNTPLQQPQEQQQTASTQPEREIILLPTDFSPAPNPFHSVFDQYVHNSIYTPFVEHHEQSELARLRNQDSVTREELDLILDHLCSNDGERDFVNVFFVDYVNNDPTFIMPTLGLFHRTSSAGMRIQLIGSQWFRSAYERVLYLCLLNTFIRLFGAHLTLYRDWQFKIPPLPRSEMRFLERAFLTQSLIKHLRSIGEVRCSICQEEYVEVFTANRMDMFASLRAHYPECTSTELMAHFRRQCLEERENWQRAQRAQFSEENSNHSDHYDDRESSNSVQHHRWLHHTPWKQVEVCRLPCQHYFCWGCIHRWLMQTSTCPNCRVKLHHVREMYKTNAKTTPLWWSTPLRVRIASCHPKKDNHGRMTTQTSNNNNNSSSNAPMLTSAEVSSSSSSSSAYSMLSSNPAHRNSQSERHREDSMRTEPSTTSNIIHSSHIVDEVHEENVHVESSVPTFTESTHNSNSNASEVSELHNSRQHPEEEHLEQQQHQQEQQQEQQEEQQELFLHEQSPLEQILPRIATNNNADVNANVESQTTESITPHSTRFVSLRNASIPMMDIYRANLNINNNFESNMEHYLVDNNINSENRIYGLRLPSVQTSISTSHQSLRALPLYMPAINTRTTWSSTVHNNSEQFMTNTTSSINNENHYTTISPLHITQTFGRPSTNNHVANNTPQSNSMLEHNINNYDVFNTNDERSSHTHVAAVNIYPVRITHTIPMNAHGWAALHHNRHNVGSNLLESHVSSLESLSYSSSSSSGSYDNDSEDDIDAESSASWNENISDCSSNSSSDDSNSINENENHGPHHRSHEDLQHCHHRHHSHRREEEEQLFFRPTQPVSAEVKEWWRQHAAERLSEHDRLLQEEWNCEVERRKKLKEEKRNRNKWKKSVDHTYNTHPKETETPLTKTFVSANDEAARNNIDNSKVSNPLSAIPSRVDSNATTNKPARSIVKRCWNKIIHHRKHKS